LLLLDRGSNTRAFIDDCFQKIGCYPRVALELGSIEVIKRLVELDFGISIVPYIAIRRELDLGTLFAIKLFKRDECRRLGVIYPVKGPHSLPAKTFLGLLKERLS
jgi:DNA-binding transcriptional LysR family regulator